MNLTDLQMKIKKNPSNYINEYNKVLELYKTIVELPKIPKKETLSIIGFLTNTSKYYPNDYKNYLILHLENIKEQKDVILNNLFSLKNQNLVSTFEYFTAIIRHTQKFQPIAKKCENELLKVISREKDDKKKKSKKLNEFQEDSLYNFEMLFKKYLKIGTERQQIFCINMLIFLYEKRQLNIKEIIIENLFVHNKIGKFILHYMVRNINDNGEYVDKNGDLITNSNKLELNSSDEDNNSKIVEEKMNNEVDYERLKKYIPRIYSDLVRKEASEISTKLFDEVKQKLDDRLIRLKKLKIISLLKNLYKIDIQLYKYMLRLVDPSRDDLKFVVNILIESMTENDVKSCVGRIMDLFCSEYRDEDFIVYGLNILKEIVLKFRVDISDKIKIFKKSKVKGIFYAYSMVMRAIKYGTCDKREVDFIKIKRRKIKAEYKE